MEFTGRAAARFLGVKGEPDAALLARIADAAPALAVERADEDVVDLPLGAVALNWLRMYLPLAAAGLPLP